MNTYEKDERTVCKNCVNWIPDGPDVIRSGWQRADSKHWGTCRVIAEDNSPDCCQWDYCEKFEQKKK